MVKGLAEASLEAHSITMEYLSLKGLLERSEVDYLRKRVSAVCSMYVRPNPAISEEELRLIKEFIAKDPDEVTLEECNRVYEIDKRWFAKLVI